MSIIYNNGANGTLKPPILNGIEEINNTDSIVLSAPNDVTINSLNFLINNVANNFNTVTYFLSASDILELNSNNLIKLNTGINFGTLTTIEILALTPSVGMQIFCSTIQQMVFYQVSPITGTVLGWYNSTGTIKL